eukprot:g10312.t1
MKVGVRVRPAFQVEVQRHPEARGGYRPAVVVDGQGRIELRTNGRQRCFSFDYTFDASCQQHEVYDSLAAPVVEGCLAGINGIILAYGQTASGKSHSMGVLQGVGIVTQATGYLEASSPADLSAKVTVSLLQIYNETVQDLLTPAAPYGVENAGLHVREDPSVGFFVDGLREYTVCSHQEAAALINLGLQQRTTAQTTKNDISSRSHTVLTINLEQRGGGVELPPFASTADVATIAGRYAGSRSRSKLVLVDLAGSERGKRSSIYLHQEAGAERVREAGFINQSLSALGNVVAALGQGEFHRPHIPFRDSKLTRILADALGGNANAALLATVGPAPQNQAVGKLRLPPSFARFTRVLMGLLQAQLSSMKREFCRRETLQQSRYETVVTRLAQELEHARNNAAAARSLRHQPNKEALSSDTHPPSKAQTNPPAMAATAVTTSSSRDTTSSASAHVPCGRVAAWDDNKSSAAAGSSAGGQTDGTESSDGDGGRRGTSLTRGDLLQENNGASRGEEVPPAWGAAATLEEDDEEDEEDDEEEGRDVRVTCAAESDVAWEMLAAALRTLEGVVRTGTEVLRQAKQAGGAASQKQPDQLGRHAPNGEANTTTVPVGTDQCISRWKKVQILQRLGQSRTLCEAQWVEAGSIFATALRDKARVEKMLRQEVVERRRHEDSARRLRGALRHLLADGENLDCTGPYMYSNPNEGPEDRPGYETKLALSNSFNSSAGTPEQKLRDGLVCGSVAHPRAADTRDSCDTRNSCDRFDIADRLGHGVALGVSGGSDLVAGTAVVGE